MLHDDPRLKPNRPRNAAEVEVILSFRCLNKSRRNWSSRMTKEYCRGKLHCIMLRYTQELISIGDGPEQVTDRHKTSALEEVLVWGKVHIDHIPTDSLSLVGAREACRVLNFK